MSDCVFATICPEGTLNDTAIVDDKLRSSTPASLRSPNMTRLVPSQFNGRCVEVKSYADLYKFFTVSFWEKTAAWRRSHGCNWLARALKLKFNLFKWIVRWICGRGDIKACNFWLRLAGCPERSVSPCSFFMSGNAAKKKSA